MSVSSEALQIESQSSSQFFKNWNGVNIKACLPIVLLGIAIWFSPTPNGLSTQAWHLFAIFVSTIVAIIAKPLPMGSLAIVSITLCTITNTLTLPQALSSYSSKVVWLVVIAFLLARGFIKTGLGARIAYYFVLLLGKSTIGLSYGLIAAETFLAPFIPSNTARGAGIIYPIVSSLTREYDSNPSNNTERRIGSYLIKLCFQANVITSGMFMTAMAANPLACSLAAKVGIDISWLDWAKAAFIPGLVCLLLLPWVIFFLYPPEIKKTPEAPRFARKKLNDMGPLKMNEWFMLITFCLLLFLWVFGKALAIHATTAAFCGLAILLLTGVLSWDDILNEKNAWNTFIWLATLLTMSNYLAEFGMIEWFSQHIQESVGSFNWLIALSLVALVYFYSHYLFASMTAHVSSMFSAFIVVALMAGAPPMVAAITLGVFSSLCGGLTHYGTGTAPVYFGTNYVPIRDWWRVGGLLSITNLVIWSIAAAIWWKMINLI